MPVLLAPLVPSIQRARRAHGRRRQEMAIIETAAPDLAQVKQRQQQMWASGDFHAGRGADPAGRRRARASALDLQAGWRVLDVACGSGNAALAAARLGCEAVGVDYVPALLARGRRRAEAEGLDVDLEEGDAEAIPFRDGEFDAVRLGLRVDVRAGPASGRRPSSRASPSRRPDRARDVDARRLHRRDAEGRRAARAAARRCRLADPVGHRDLPRASSSATRSRRSACRSGRSSSASAPPTPSSTSSAPTTGRR